MANDSVGLFDKLKLLLWINGILKGGGKVGNFIGKLDGFKSVAGLLMVVAYYALPNFGVHAPDVVLKIGTGLAGIGLAHKLEKGVGFLTKGLDIAQKVLDVSRKVLDTLNAKEAPKA